MEPNIDPEICDNGIDDNADGFVDCADVLCRNDPNCATQAPAMSPPTTALLVAILTAFGLLSLGLLQRRAQPAKR